jgi:hypothetical protein
MQFLPCFLCGDKLEKRSDKHSKPYFVCNGCGIQLFVRKKHGIERLDKLLDATEKMRYRLRRLHTAFLRCKLF